MPTLLEKLTFLFPDEDQFLFGLSTIDGGQVIVDWQSSHRQPTQEEFDAIPEEDIEKWRDNNGRLAMVVTPWQIRKALNTTGKRGQVNAAINQADQDTQDGWEVATQFERLHPMVVSLGSALGLTDTELDDLFILAASL